MRIVVKFQSYLAISPNGDGKILTNIKNDGGFVFTGREYSNERNYTRTNGYDFHAVNM